MKKTILFVCFWAMISFTTQAQSDEDLIKATLNNYLDGGTNGDPEQFKSAFVNDAVQRGISSKGTVTGMTVESLSSKIKPGQKMERTTSIVSYSYAGNCATAVTETAYETSKIIDMLNLLKIGNEWKIVTRVYSRIEKTENVVSSMGGKAMPAARASSAKAPATAKATPAKAAAPAAAPKKKPVADDGW